MTMSDVKVNRFAMSARSVLSRSDVFGGTALAALLVIAAVIALLEPQFLTYSNLLNIGRQASVLVIVACGMTMVILSGNIDLSVGSAIALCSVIGASLATDAGLSAPVTVAIMIGLGAVIGALKGALIAWGRFNSFIVTLGMMTVLGGWRLPSQADIQYPASPMGFDFSDWSCGRRPLPLIVAAAVFVVAALLLSKTVLGRHIYAIGGNETSSHIAGVPVSLTKLMVFVVSGGLCGLAAVVLLGRLGAGLPTAAQGMELDAIAAVILGGSSLFGGRGSVFGTLFGALILAVLQNGLNFMGVNSFIIQILLGVIIILAVLLDRFRPGN